MLTVPSFFGASSDVGLTVAKIIEALRLIGPARSLYVNEQGHAALQSQVEASDAPGWQGGFLSRFRGIVVYRDDKLEGHAILIGDGGAVKIICREFKYNDAG